MKVLIIGEKNWHGRWTEATLSAFEKVSEADIFFYKEESRNILIRGRNYLRKKNKQLILKAGDLEEETLFNLKKYVPILANWWVDDPFNQDANQNLYKYYDFFFVFDTYYIAQLEKLGLKNSYWLVHLIQVAISQVQQIRSI